ncbi:hypothetical protein NC651_031865 [Populus alba x Populus x berolinensis]|nr:hypothetical protein NC651_031865 [Populus alba x Populus x berolinensis]
MTLKSYKFAVPSGFPPSNMLSDRSRECSPLKHIIQMAILHKGHIPRVSVLPFQNKRGRNLLILKLLAVQFLNIQLLLPEIALDQSSSFNENMINSGTANQYYTNCLKILTCSVTKKKNGRITYLKEHLRHCCIGMNSNNSITLAHISGIAIRILALNAAYLLKTGSHFVLSIKANCIDSAVPAGKAYDSEVAMLRADLQKPAEMVTLDRFERDHARVIGSYRVPKKQKIAAKQLLDVQHLDPRFPDHLA